MKTIALAAALYAVALFNGSTESKWTVTSGGKSVGAITLLTNGGSARAEWKKDPKSPASVYIGTQGKIWLRAAGGDVDLDTISATTPENVSVAALLLPHANYAGAKATYASDAKGPSSINVTFGGTKLTLTRTSLATSTADASNFAVHPRKSAASRLARLSGDLLGPSDASVSAGAAGRGAGEKGLKLKDGGDYDAVLKLENRDAKWRAKLDAALAEFQKQGKVGKERENQ